MCINARKNNQIGKFLTIYAQLVQWTAYFLLDINRLTGSASSTNDFRSSNMRRNRKMKRSKARKAFKKGANKTHRKNLLGSGIMRGGYRL